MQARAGAIDELIASGALEDQLSLGGGGDDIDRELAALSSGSDVEAELARLKAGDRGGRPGEAPRPSTPTGPRAGRDRAEPVAEPAERTRSSHDRPHPRRGAVGRSTRRTSRRSTPSTTAVEQAVEAGDEAAFARGLVALLDVVRQQGTRLEDDSLEESDLILPMSDATLEEVRALLTDEGLVPD